jgi:hypothetical protein
MQNRVALALVAAILTALLAICVHYRAQINTLADTAYALQKRIGEQAAECAEAVSHDDKMRSACFNTCQTIDWDTENRDGPKFVYTCQATREHSGFACIWTNVDENLRPKKARR